MGPATRQPLLTIDGSSGEGGGQILRTSLACSLLTGVPFRLKNIRAKRSNPGLQAQHLTCVKAAAALGNAELVGAELKSRELEFVPHTLAPGEYEFAVQTAGATGLVAQTIVVPLAMAGGGHLVIEGGTHVILAPTATYLQQAFLPVCAEMNLHATAEMLRPGFYPRGGGRLEVTVDAVTAPLTPLVWMRRGELRDVYGQVVFSNLPEDVADRAEKALRQALTGWLHGRQLKKLDVRRRTDMPANNPGGVAGAFARWECGLAMYESIAERGKRAEKLGKEAGKALATFATAGDGESTAPTVDEHLADQLLLPMALAFGESQFRTPTVTGHLITNAEVVRMFVDCEIEIAGKPGDANVPVIVRGSGFVPEIAE